MQLEDFVNVFLTTWLKEEPMPYRSVGLKRVSQKNYISEHSGFGLLCMS